MNCQTVRDHFPDLLDPRTQTMPASVNPAFVEARTHLANCPDCQREFAALSQTAAALDALDVAAPSTKLRRDFYAMLEEEKHSAASAVAAATRLRRHHVWWRFIVAPLGACALLAAGFLAGTRYGVTPVVTTSPTTVANDETKQQLKDLQAKVDQMEKMNQLVAYQLSNNQTRPANERLNTVLTSATQQNPTDRMINELITSLALDTSPNVRLRALDALYPHANLELVRTAVVASLTRETSPLVQVAMIDFLAAARDHEAKPTLEKLTANQLVDENVRIAAKRAIAQL
jgi:hypothetical protein